MDFIKKGSKTMEKEEILECLTELMGEAMGCDKEDVDVNASFFAVGSSAVQALKIINKLRKKLNVDINPVAMFEFKCAEDLAGYLSECTMEDDEDE